VTRANGDVLYYFLDTDTYIPIKIETHTIVRGAEREYDSTLGDYEEVAGWYVPYSLEISIKGTQNKQTLTFDKIEANLPLDDSLFEPPVIQPGQASLPDASRTQPMKPLTE